MATRTGFLFHERYLWHDTRHRGGLHPRRGHGRAGPATARAPTTKRRLRNLLDVTGLLDAARPARARARRPTRRSCACTRPRTSSGVKRDRGRARRRRRRARAVRPRRLRDRAALGGRRDRRRRRGARRRRRQRLRARPPARPPRRARRRQRLLRLRQHRASRSEHAREACAASARVAVVDWDVHHGNGTEHAFLRATRACSTISLHQDDYYPAGSRHASTTPARAPARATTSTCRCRPARGTAPTRRRSSASSCRRCARFRPELILVASRLRRQRDGPARPHDLATSDDFRALTAHARRRSPRERLRRAARARSTRAATRRPRAVLRARRDRGDLGHLDAASSTRSSTSSWRSAARSSSRIRTRRFARRRRGWPRSSDLHPEPHRPIVARRTRRSRAPAPRRYPRPVADVPLRLVPDPRKNTDLQRTPAPSAAGAGNPYTSMAPEFGRTASLFARRFFSQFDFESDDVERLRALDRQGAVVYVMRYSSRLDYFLFNWLFLREGLRLSASRTASSSSTTGRSARRCGSCGGDRRAAAGAERARMREQSIQQIRDADSRGRLRCSCSCAPTSLRPRAARRGARSARGPDRARLPARGRRHRVRARASRCRWFRSRSSGARAARPAQPFLNLFYGAASARPTSARSSRSSGTTGTWR